eukprot:8697060-Lingulodinium_polyedra.AAC.1
MASALLGVADRQRAHALRLAAGARVPAPRCLFYDGFSSTSAILPLRSAPRLIAKAARRRSLA